MMAVDLAPRTGLIGKPLSNGLVLPADLTFEEWRDSLYHADLFVEASPWFLVDLMVYGENHFPDEYTQAFPTSEEDKYGASQARMRQARWMADRFPTVATRVPGLTYTHHRIAAELKAEPCFALLHEAARAEKPVSTRELIERVKEIKEREKAIPADSEPVVSSCAAEWQPTPADLLPEHRAALEAAALDADLDDPRGFAAGALWMAQYTASEALFHPDRWRE